MRVVLTLSLAPLVLAACGHDGSPPTPVTSAESWPAADALFHQDPAWLGADGAYSIDLGGGRVLWLFGDTFVATSSAHERSESTMVHNTVAIQTGYDPSMASIVFRWGGGADAGAPDAFFPGPGADWYWPAHAAMVDGRLVVFLSRVASSTGGLGFESAGWTAVRIDDPGDDPSSWSPVLLTTPASSMGVTFGETAFAQGGYLYVFGAEDANRAVHVMRWPTAAITQGDLSAPEWWTPSGWIPQAQLSSLPPALVADGATELSVQPAPGGAGWLEVQTVGFGAATLDVRTAPDFTGPWGSPSVVYVPPESSRSNVLVYAGKGHPELQGAPLIATYASGSTSFSTLVADTTLGYPRFVRVTWPPDAGQ